MFALVSTQHDTVGVVVVDDFILADYQKLLALSELKNDHFLDEKNETHVLYERMSQS